MWFTFMPLQNFLINNILKIMLTLFARPYIPSLICKILSIIASV